jgi:ABC-2 type transport system permease protein
MGQETEWPFVTELKKQYEVSSIALDAPIPNNLDVLLVAQPSSMTQGQIDSLTDYVRQGHPTLLFHDPLPMFNPMLAPEVPKMPAGGPMGGGQPPEPKGNLQPLLDLLGIDAPGNEVVWNRYNPLLNLPELPYEFVFVGKGSGGADAFNPSEPASSGLQELVMMFPGLVRPKGSKPEFTPLLRVGGIGGTLPFSEVVQQSFMGVSGINPNRRHFPSNMEYTLAARIQGKPQEEIKPEDPAKKEAAKPAPAEVKAIVIGDLDLIGEQFFAIRRQKVENLDFDNITFVLNCVDVLAGDDAYIALRKRRAQHRTLARLEQQTRDFVSRSQKEAKAAEDEAKDALERAQKSLDAKVAKVRDDKELDDRTRDIKLQTLERVENRRFEVEKAAIEDDKRRKVQESKATMEQSVRAIENRVRVGAILAAPLPALLLATFIFGIRAGKENQGANPNRLA